MNKFSNGPFSLFISFTFYPEDDVHIGTFGILELGERFAKVIINQAKK